MKNEALERKFQKLGLRRSFDFVLHLPLRYEDETVLGTADTAVPGEPLQIEAKVQRAEIAYRPRRQLVVHAEGLVLRFYNFYGSQLKQLQRAATEGLRVRAFGELRGGWFGAEMVHPRYRIVGEGEPLPEALTPIYPATAGLPQRELRERVLRALDSEPLAETLSDELRKRYSLAGFAESVTLLHRARPGNDLEAAWRRMKFDEVLAQQLSMRFAYRERHSRRAPKLPGDGPLLKAFFERLRFKLTRSQSLAAGQVLKDLAAPHPMQRLLQGDVGSGKTVVAAIACLAAVDAGWQAAVMAPTEILSEQHFRKFSEWLAPLGVTIGWLHGKVHKKEKLAAAEAQIVIGTHALIERGVEFKRLGLAVIDEQHRFGVDQRLKLGRKRARVHPHQLMMSATPIPRTLEMTAYGDLDLSSITELPPGRRPVATRLFADAKRGEVLDRIRASCAEGQQAYWVCPVIEESKEGVQTAVATYERLRAELSGLRVGLLHGRLPSDEKAAAMQTFVAGETQLLVCTTVIEVGVDVPNASLMVIESAERFGLAQLHQLRGRIGRGSRESVCILLYGELSDTARQRLKVIFGSNDGFAIAQQDLQIRGPGEFLGERQSGQRVLRYADVFDVDLIRQAREAADAMPDDAARAHVERWYGSKRDLLDA
ncbi:ATP-dependent DNA helicase RecG [Betaproteobacteria bacterium SCGC AG-212-J23]|nr:ATP-dependent DNA helicase RecG [Betaproteobacteria bacterium SCGC AG-212-J23]